jgi:hypothetical protein
MPLGCLHSLTLVAVNSVATLKAKWEAAAAAVAANLKTQLWNTSQNAMFARDAGDEIITTMVHDNLRVMWMGAVLVWGGGDVLHSRCAIEIHGDVD